MDYIVEQCIPLQMTSILVIYDDSTKELLEYLKASLVLCGKTAKICKIENATRHGMEPSEVVANEMLQHDVIMCITLYSLAHTKARLMAHQKGIPFLSMPGYNIEMMKNSAFLADYHETFLEVKRFTEKLTQSDNIHIISENGTDLYLNTHGRIGNCCPGYIDEYNLLGSPPDIEANIAPIETETEGTIVVDGSITDPRIGLLNSQVILGVKSGAVVRVFSEDKKIESLVEKIFADVGDEKAYIIGELGVGFNKKATLCGNMLIDEGTKGCIHFGIGSNCTIGGRNEVSFHLDFVMKKATIIADGYEIIKKGVIVNE